MKVNKFVKKHAETIIRLENFAEDVWELVYKIPYIGKHIVWDFYPYKGRGPAFKWYEIFTWKYLRYSSLADDIITKVSKATEYVMEAIQKTLIGKHNIKKLNLIMGCNDSKLLESDGWSFLVRNRQSVTKYYRVHAYPFGYFTIDEDVYGEGVNLFMHSTFIMLGDEDEEEVPVTKTTRQIYSGWTNRIADVLKMARAYSMAYEGRRNFYHTSVEFREEMRKWREEENVG